MKSHMKNSIAINIHVVCIFCIPVKAKILLWSWPNCPHELWTKRKWFGTSRSRIFSICTTGVIYDWGLKLGKSDVKHKQPLKDNPSIEQWSVKIILSREIIQTLFTSIFTRRKLEGSLYAWTNVFTVSVSTARLLRMVFVFTKHASLLKEPPWFWFGYG